MIPLAIPNLAGREAEYLQECITSTFVSSVGPYVDRFEDMVAKASGARRSSTKKRQSVSQAPAIKLEGGAARLSRRSSIFRKLIKYALIVGVVLCVFPVLLTLIYLPSAVKPVSTLMIQQRFSGETVKRDWVPLEKISPFVWQSVVSSEDGQFCSHHGVDWNQINIVIDDALEGEPVRGASTITMQSVKNLYLWPSRSYVRKVLEVPLALLVNAIWGKKRTMEIYLNIAEWGPGIYGIEAAAQHHFKRSAARLTRKQAALLAVTLPNPILRNPRKPNRGMRNLARLVERRARASGAYVKCLQGD